MQLLKPELDGDSGGSSVAIHTRKAERRLNGSQLPIDHARVRAVGQRQVMADDDTIKLSWLACRLVGGQLNSWLLELRDETETTTHPGEEFVFCLKGPASSPCPALSMN